uniref:F-box domain-containing protein n=1 Tax=Strongyloides papillosus TaxID=174720 RepID=A0A0N5BYV7_STREA
MDKPAMNFVFLPGDLKLQIFKKLDWETLKDLKLVCKDFYILIGENTQFLDRPKVHSLLIVFDENKISRVSFMLVLTGERDGLAKDIEFSNDDEYENFLKKIDVTKLRFLNFQNGANVEFVHVRCESFSGANSCKYTFSARLSNGRRCILHYLFVETKSSTEFGILYGCNFLKKDSLGKLGLFEGNGPHLVEKKITVDLLVGSPMLGYEIVPIDTRKLIDIQVMNHLFELGFFNPEDTCDRKQFILIFDKVYKFGVLRQNFYREFFDKITFNNNLIEKNNRNRYMIMSSMRCSKCGIEHQNSIYYRRDSKELIFKFY